MFVVLNSTLALQYWLYYNSSSLSLSFSGADALADTPEIINWLVEVCTSHPLVQGQKVHIYSGIYLDGGKFVRASMAMEMIISELTKRLPSSMTPSLLYIDTPSHAHTVKRATYDGHIEQRKCFISYRLLLFVGQIYKQSTTTTTTTIKPTQEHSPATFSLLLPSSLSSIVMQVATHHFWWTCCFNVGLSVIILVYWSLVAVTMWLWWIFWLRSKDQIMH